MRGLSSMSYRRSRLDADLERLAQGATMVASAPMPARALTVPVLDRRESELIESALATAVGLLRDDEDW